MTIIVKSFVVDNSLSFAVSLSIYVPGPEKLAVVANEEESLNVTLPGPLNLLHKVVSVAGVRV